MKNGRAFVMCSNSRLGEDAKPILQSNKMPYGAVKKLEVYKPSSSPADSGQSGKSEQNEDMIKVSPIICEVRAKSSFVGLPPVIMLIKL